MFKTDFIGALAHKHGCTKIEAEKFIDDFFGLVIEGALRDEFVQITGYGTFEYKYHPERKAINPKTREDIVTPPTSSIRFRPGKRMRDL